MLDPLSYPARGLLRRKRGGEKYWDFDGVEGVTQFFPVIAVTPFHFWNWHRVSSHWVPFFRTEVYSFRVMPIRWSLDLLVRPYVRIWIWVPMLLGFLTTFSCNHGILVRLFGLLTFLACMGCWIGFRWTEQTHRNIRRLLGRHKLGTSDPASWTDDLLALLKPAEVWFGTVSFAAAVEDLLRQQRWSEAMWAARLCVALESAEEGRHLTRRVLGDERVQAVLADLKRYPDQTRELLNQQHPHPFPRVRPLEGKDGAFWHSILVEKRTENREVIFAVPALRLLAWLLRTPTPEEEEQKHFYYRKARSGPNRHLHVLGGSGLFAAFFLLVIGQVVLLEKTQQPTLADLAIQRAAFQGNPPAAPEPKRDAPPPPAPPVDWNKPDPGLVQYLIDLPEEEVKEGPWKLGKGSLGNPGQTPITVGGVRSPKGLGLHPPTQGHASVKYRLDRRAKTFKSAVALDDTGGGAPWSATFEVWGDGRRLWQSKPQNEKGRPEECAVDVTDVATLELRVSAPTSHVHLHAVWLEPRLLLK